MSQDDIDEHKDRVYAEAIIMNKDQRFNRLSTPSSFKSFASTTSS
jgi:hypothetical protein